MNALGVEEIDLPVREIRTTRGLTPERRRELGLPEEDLQMRTEDYSRTSVDKIKDNFDTNKYDDIRATQGTDGNYYVISGHSRLQAFKEMNRDLIPAKVTQGDAAAVSDAAAFSNRSGNQR